MRRNDYKRNKALNNMRAKKGQVAIFIIIGIVIVSIFIWFVVKPRLPASFGGAEINPSAFMRECLKQDLAETAEKISLHGGLFTPTHYVTYKGEQIQYLCYTAEDYKPCVVQQPLLVKKVSDEIKAQVEPKARACMDSLNAYYEKQNYRDYYVFQPHFLASNRPKLLQPV